MKLTTLRNMILYWIGRPFLTYHTYNDGPVCGWLGYYRFRHTVVAFVAEDDTRHFL